MQNRFSGNGTVCTTDINECSTGQHSCHSNATCSNNVGSGQHMPFKCNMFKQCHIHVNAKTVLVEMELFVPTSMNVQQDNIHAIQMQHVQTMLDHIHVNAKMELFVPTSMNVQQAIFKQCWKWNCECTTGQHSCHSNATCSNNVGSYSCQCKIGKWNCLYTLMSVQQDNIHAIQMQHVQTMLHHIHVNATVDLVEMELFVPTSLYTTCQCNMFKQCWIIFMSMQQWNWKTVCADINECTTQHSCHSNATCSNNVGSFQSMQMEWKWNCLCRHQ